MQRQVVLVDKGGKELGLEEIFAAHANPGSLHRAISVLLWRKKEHRTEVLIQQRSMIKPLWPGYWANTVCTHPYPGEEILDCAYRRLREEVGIEMSDGLVEVFEFDYQADYNEELSEHEHDHVVIGEYGGVVTPNPEEVMNYRWVEVAQLKGELVDRGGNFAPWIKLIMVDKRLRIGQ